MKTLELKDKAIFQKYLSHKKYNLSTFSFVNIFIWKNMFKISWKIIDGALCVFMQDSIGCFMYLPPLGRKITKEILDQCFSIMDKLNSDKSISRIENVEKDDVESYRLLGLKSRFKSNDYLYSKKDLVSLSGNRYKSKRSASNHFVKNYNFDYKEFSSEFTEDCLALYEKWVEQRKSKYSDPIYHRMLEDNYHTNRLVMSYCRELGLVGRIVEIDDKIKGYSFGYKLNNDTFCVLFEVTDLEIKGLAQYIFREFIRDSNGISFINVMDDSGLKNLSKVKNSYRPVRLEPSYLITRNQ